MAINLEKGQRVELGLRKAVIGLGWDPNENTGFDFDLDASGFMLAEGGKIPSDDFFVFYNNPKSPDGAVESSGDDLTGGNSDGGDDESLTVEFAKLDPRITEIVVVVTIHDYETRKQNFGQVRNSYIRICDGETEEEILKYELDEDFSVETACEFGRLYKKDGGWRFEALGVGAKGGLEIYLSKYN